MSIGYRVWVFSLLGAAALLAPACDDDDSASNNNDAGGAAGTGTAGDRNTAGHTTIGGAVSGGDAGNGGAGVGGGGAGAPTCGKLDLASGVVTCGEVKYRERAGTGCFWSPPDKAQGGAGGGAGTSGGAGQSLGGSDATDSGCSPDNCTEKPRGYCEAEAPGASGAGPVACHYGCLVDSECGANEICVCSGDPSYGGRCVEAFCKTDADCTNGNRCGSSTACDQFSCNDDPVCAIH